MSQSAREPEINTYCEVTFRHSRDAVLIKKWNHYLESNQNLKYTHARLWLVSFSFFLLDTMLKIVNVRKYFQGMYF